jgi:hypothetical protein
MCMDVCGLVAVCRIALIVLRTCSHLSHLKRGVFAIEISSGAPVSKILEHADYLPTALRQIVCLMSKGLSFPYWVRNEELTGKAVNLQSLQRRASSSSRWCTVRDLADAVEWPTLPGADPVSARLELVDGLAVVMIRFFDQCVRRSPVEKVSFPCVVCVSSRWRRGMPSRPFSRKMWTGRGKPSGNIWLSQLSLVGASGMGAIKFSVCVYGGVQMVTTCVPGYYVIHNPQQLGPDNK